MNQTAQRFTAAEMLRTNGDVLAASLLRADRDKRLTPTQRAELDDWVTQLTIVRNLATNTVSRYLDYVVEFFAWANGNDLSIATVRHKDAEAWLVALLMEHHDSNTTRSVKLSAVKQFYKWRETVGGGESPVRLLQAPRRDKLIPRKFTTRQLNKIFSHMDLATAWGRRDFSILVFAHATGARISELAGLQLKQLKLSDRKGAVTLKGKGAKEREVPFNGIVAEALRMWLIDRDTLDVYDNAAVWVSLTGASKGKQLKQSGIEGIVNRAVDGAGIEPDERAQGIHRFRATFASDMYDETKDIELVRILMGHDDINTTRKYIEISETTRKHSMPNSRTAEVIGMNNPKLPLWFKKRGQAVADQ